MSAPTSPPNACPKCGTALPSAATAGLCPRCLMAEAMQATQTEAAPATPQKALSPVELAPHFPQLEVLECLGRGGMGVVYKVRQKALNRFAALKLLAPERVADAKFAQRFTHEAQALAALNHPSIVTIYDFGQAGGFYFLLMEFVDGVNLRQAMKAGRFTPEQALAVVPPVCEALQYAHEHGIVHRDIKPENLLMDKAGRVKIADFGIAKMLGGDATGASLDQPPAESPVNEGTLASTAGTPQYMAPEQKAHRRTDHRADIYSLGVVLYELLTGELPADKLQPPSRKVQIDVRLDEIVLRALEAKPELRFQTAGEFRTQVEKVTSTPDGDRGESAAAESRTPPEMGSSLSYPFRFSRRNLASLLLLLVPLNGAIIWAFVTAARLLTDFFANPSLAQRPDMDPAFTTKLANFLADHPGIVSFVAIFVCLVADALIIRRVRRAMLVPTASSDAAVPSGLRAADAPGRSRSPRRQGWVMWIIRICLVIFVIPPVAMMIVGLLSYRQASAPSGVARFDIVPAGVTGNVVIVDVTAEVGRGHAELRAALDGPQLPAATDAALAETFSPPFAGTFIKPTPYAGNHPFRIVSPGRMTWLLGFVLPDAALAKSALENLRPIGPLASVAGRTFAGTLFEVRQTNGQVFHASLQVGPPVTAADPNWVSVSSAPSTPSASALSSYDESGRVILKWEVQASQPGIVLLHREDGQSTASLRRDPKTKLYQAGISVELTKVGTDRVLLVTSGGGILREELTGNFRDLAAELWSYKNLSAKTERGTEIELCRFQGKPITVQVPVLTVTPATPPVPGTNPGIQRVEISTDKAVVHQAHYDGSGLLITFGTRTNRWTPSGRYLDGLFNVTLEWPAFGSGSLHVIKPRHGIHMNYRLDGPPGPMVGKLVFNPGMALPDAEGFCVIGKFQPDTGEPLPLAVQLGTDQPTQPGGAAIRPSTAGTSATTTAPITFRRDGVSWSFLIVGIGAIGLFVIGGIVLLVWLVRKGGTAGKVALALLAVALLVFAFGIAALVGYKWMATSSVQGAAQVASEKLGQMVLESNFPNSLVPQPRGRVLQTQNGFRVHLPAMQLASFEFLIRDADDSWRAVPALTAYVATGTNGGYHDTLYWTLRRDDMPHTENSTNQLWFWSVSATVNGGQQLPNLADHGTNFTHTLARGDQLDWSQLAIPPQTKLKPGEELLLPLFRTFGSATARGNMPKEAAVRVRCEPLPAALNLTYRDQFMELGLAAHKALMKVLPAKPTSPAAPAHIEFKVLRVENPPGTRDIHLHFERDTNPALGLEVWQDVTPSPGLHKQPQPGTYLDSQMKTWLGVNHARVLRWTLPNEFTEAEGRAVVKDIEQRAKVWRALDEGHVLGVATVTHRDGWKYHLVATVKRTPGFANPPPPPPAPAPLIRREERGKTRDGRDFAMTFEELQRDEKTSTVRVKTVNGGSVGSAMFEVRGNWDIAKARGAAYFINLKSWQGENGQWMSLTGFAQDKDVDPKTYFDLKEPLPADKRLIFLSVAAYERLFKGQP